MTTQQIEKLRAVIKQLLILKKNPNANEIVRINSALDNYFQNSYPMPYLNINDLYLDELTPTHLIDDIDNIVSTLEGMMANDPKASECGQILDVIEEGRSVFNADYETKQKYVSKVFYSYNSQIKFDKSIEEVAKRSILYKTDIDFAFGDIKCEIDDVVIQGIIVKLQRYVELILQDNGVVKKQSSSPHVVINNSPTMSAVASVENSIEIDISVMIEQARKQIEDEGLSDAQSKEINDKLTEIQNIAQSNESRGKRWQKAKNILKWVAEQGITVAGILLPILGQTIK